MVDRRTSIPFSKLHSVFFVAVTLLAGCPQEDAPAPEPDETEAGERDNSAETDVDAAADGGDDASPYAAPLSEGEWQSLSFDERKRFMRELVMPTMKPLFTEFDSDHFASVKCSTCHGSGAADGTFAMPNSDLPALGGQNPPAPDERQLRTIEFMRSVVKPKIAELLGEPNLRCNNCHPSAS
jgi:hypothetical protein